MVSPGSPDLARPRPCAAEQARIAEASEATAAFYAERRAATARRAAANREAEAAWVEARDVAALGGAGAGAGAGAGGDDGGGGGSGGGSGGGGPSWSAVCDLVDLRETAGPAAPDRGTARMRSVLTRLKHGADAP